MEMDYQQLDGGDERLHDNLFSNPFRSIAMEFGGYAVGSGVQNMGNKSFKTALDAGKAASSKGTGGLAGWLEDPSRNKMARGLASRDMKRAQGTMNFGKSIKRFGHVFGLIGLAQIAFEVSSSVLGASQSFATSKSDVEAMRYSKMYDQDAYYDTRAAYTQRQRALQVIHNSRLSLKPALGNESGFLHS